MPFNNQSVKKSPAFARQLKAVLKTGKDERLYLRELEKLAQEHIAWQIRTARIKQKLSQESLAKKIRTTQAVVSRIERGGVDVRLSTIIRLGTVLGLNVLGK